MTNLLLEFFARLRRDERGATLVEYGIALFVAISVGGFLLTNLAGTTGENFTSADDAATYSTDTTNGTAIPDAPDPTNP